MGFFPSSRPDISPVMSGCVGRQVDLWEFFLLVHRKHAASSDRADGKKSHSYLITPPRGHLNGTTNLPPRPVPASSCRTMRPSQRPYFPGRRVPSLDANWLVPLVCRRGSPRPDLPSRARRQDDRSSETLKPQCPYRYTQTQPDTASA